VVRFLLIAASLTGCYRPSLIDCQNTCDELNLCPSGLSCVQGFCTSGTSCMADASAQHDSWMVDVVLAADVLETDAAVDALAVDAVAMADASVDAGIDAGIDAMIDASIDAMPDAEMIDAPMIDAMIDAMVDAPVDAMVDAAIDAMIDAPPDAPPDALVADAPTDAKMCPQVPPMGSGCMPPMGVLPTPPFCYVLCTNAVLAATALNYSVVVGASTWRAAIIDDPSGMAETAALALVSGLSGDAWIGLEQSTATLPGANWHWYNQTTAQFTYNAWASGQPDDAGGGENQQEDCGAIGVAGWYDESCTTSRPFLIEPF
jgi:hypothetical protein